MLDTGQRGQQRGVGHDGFVANLGQLDQPGAVANATGQVGGAPRRISNPDDVGRLAGAEVEGRTRIGG
ncbi:MAG: hypothetical protein JO023_11330 [Chloroflexi bacterium]|nr:hypothetical protein [Chloroflexota bacterium]